MGTFFNRVKCFLGEHLPPPGATQLLRDNKGKVVYTVCDRKTCTQKIKLKRGYDEEHFVIEEVR